MTAWLLLSWREGVAIDAAGDERRVRGPSSVIVLRQLVPALITPIDQLMPCGAEEDRLEQRILESAGAGVLAQWY